MHQYLRQSRVIQLDPANYSGQREIAHVTCMIIFLTYWYFFELNYI